MFRLLRLVPALAALSLSTSALAQADDWAQANPSPDPTTEAPPQQLVRSAPPPQYTAEPQPRPLLVRKKKVKKPWDEVARFFVGARGGVAVAPGAEGASPTAGMELGVVADEGLGLGLHLLWTQNSPGSPALGIPPARWAMGAAADFRWYIQTVRPLTLYPTLSVGFMAGTGLDGRNAVLPMFNPGFGARVRMGKVYASFEFGAVGFQIPFIAIALGWEPDRPPPVEEDYEQQT